MGCHVISPLLEALEQGHCHLPGFRAGRCGQDSCTCRGIWGDGSNAATLSDSVVPSEPSAPNCYSPLVF